jgi:hypothetical protein
MTTPPEHSEAANLVVTQTPFSKVRSGLMALAGLHPILSASASHGDDGIFATDRYSGIVMDAIRPGCGFVIGASKSPIADGEAMAKHVCVPVPLAAVTSSHVP